jgi:hypothetical protein
MGEDTIEFASRFSTAVRELADLGRSDGYRSLEAIHGAGLAARVRADLDAIEAVFHTGTKAVRNWTEQRRRVLEQVAAMRGALERSGIDRELRRMALDLVGAIEPGRAARTAGRKGRS